MSLLIPNQPFARYHDYLAPLLSLMGQIGTAPLADVKREFDKQYSQFIPPKDRELMNNGKEHWAYHLDWASSDLTQLGFMERAGRGIWAISDDGRIWLKTHPDYDYALRSINTFMSEKARELRGKVKIQNPYKFSWLGQEYLADASVIIKNATNQLDHEKPAEAFRYKDWYVVVNNQKISPKWLFHLLTGKGSDEFVTYHAVIIFRMIGLSVFKLGEKEKQSSGSKIKPTLPYFGKSYDLDAISIKLFFTEVEKLLSQKLTDFAPQARIHAHPELKYIHISFSEFSFARYVMELRQEDEISWRFESQIEEVNYQRLNQVLPSLAQWQESLKADIRAEKWGGHRARFGVFLTRDEKFHMYLGVEDETISPNEVRHLSGNNIFEVALKHFAEQMPAASFWEIKAQAYATLVAQFIQVTLPDMQNLFGNSVRSKRSPANQAKIQAGSNLHQHELIDQKINEIRDFLAGRAVRGPKDEELCDWIQLCYLFDLPGEGQQLFTFVQSQTLNNEWLYHRTKRYADLCRLKAASKRL